MTNVSPDPFALEMDAFTTLAKITQDASGLQLFPEKRLMVQSRLKPRLSALQIHDFSSYVAHVQSADGKSELRHMISALTTNVTQFFREFHHFEMLTEVLVPVLRRKIASNDRVRIWSAGCSKGQEPYSIAMHLLHALPALAEADFKILATDIDPKVVSHAIRGEYDRKELEAVPKELVNAFIAPGHDHQTVRINENLARHIVFKELNLVQSWPMRGQFDAIFCRNVVIYFKAETQEKLWPRFTTALHPEGVLFLGHSERIGEPSDFGLKSIGTTAYAHATSGLHASSTKN